MARTVLPIVGAAVGFWFGGPAGAQVGFMLGGAIGGAVDPVVNKGPKIGETGAQTSAEGAPRAIVYGTASVTGNIIATGPMIETTNTETQSKGGPVSETAVAYRNYAIRICEGPIAGVLRVWQDDKLVYDIRPGSLLAAASTRWLSNKIIYLGTETQLPDIFLELNVSGIGETPAYRGTAYIVFGLEDLTDRRGSIPQYRFEVAKEATESVVALHKVDVRSLGSTTGGGNFTNYFLAEVPMSAPGSCFLASWYFQPLEVDSTITLQVKVGGIVVWSLGVNLIENVPQSFKVQINHAPDNTLFTAGHLGTFSGGMRVSTSGLSEDYDAYVTSGAIPELYEASNSDFGLLIDSVGNLAYAGPQGLDPDIPWGPPSIDLGLQGEGAILGDIVADIHDRCGIAATKFDRSELTDLVAGLVLAGEYTGADAINALRGPYFFDKTEYDKKLWYPKRGKAVVETLTIDDLVDEPDTARREQALEFPKKLHLFYQHAASGYAAVKATSSRSSPDARVIGEASVQVPVVLDENQAAQTAHKMHKVAWAEAEGEVQLSVPESFIRLVPSDNVGLFLRGQVKRLRIEKTEHADGVITLTLRHDRQSAYTSVVTGVPIPLPTLPPAIITNATTTTFSFIDIGARIDGEDDLHYLVAGSSADAAWYGWTLQRSLDGGATYTNVASYSTPAVMGTLMTAVPAASEHYTDTTNTVRVELLRDTQTIDSITEAQFLSEGGAFALENADGTWEVMQYLDAVQDSGGVYELSTLHRGRLNSGAGAHSVGARFVMLNTAFHVPAQSAWLGQNITHRAVSLGQSPELATVLTKTFVGRSQTEWPIASLDLARSGADVITATWAPRHRFGTDDAPVASTHFTGYRVTIDGTVTFDTTTAGFTYDASALGDPLDVTVSALNRYTGAGPATTGSV